MNEHPVSRRSVIAGLASAAIGATFLGALPAAAVQERMQTALRALENAASQLQAAAHDKGGHREAAINLVQQAISQVQQGIAAGR